MRDWWAHLGIASVDPLGFIRFFIVTLAILLIRFLIVPCFFCPRPTYSSQSFLLTGSPFVTMTNYLLSERTGFAPPLGRTGDHSLPNGFIPRSKTALWTPSRSQLPSSSFFTSFSGFYLSRMTCLPDSISVISSLLELSPFLFFWFSFQGNRKVVSLFFLLALDCFSFFFSPGDVPPFCRARAAPPGSRIVPP